MWQHLFLLCALCLTQAAVAQEPTQATLPFFVSDNINLHIEGTDEDFVILEKIASLLRLELEQAVVADSNQRDWPVDLVLKLDADAATPPYEAIFSISELKNEDQQQVFSYGSGSTTRFRAAIRKYFQHMLDVGFTARQIDASISDKVELYLKSTDQDIPMLREISMIVREVLDEAVPLDGRKSFPARRLKLTLESDVEPPFEAILSLADRDFPENHRFQTVFYYDPAKRQAFKAQLREFLIRLLDVKFPGLPVQGAENITPVAFSPNLG
jgi:hypothetical protein